jgi:hypothetical protein
MCSAIVCRRAIEATRDAGFFTALLGLLYMSHVQSRRIDRGSQPRMNIPQPRRRGAMDMNRGGCARTRPRGSTRHFARWRAGHGCWHDERRITCRPAEACVRRFDSRQCSTYHLVLVWMPCNCSNKHRLDAPRRKKDELDAEGTQLHVEHVRESVDSRFRGTVSAAPGLRAKKL